MQRGILIGIGIVLVLLVVLAVNGLRGRIGWTAVARTPDDLAGTLAPGYSWTSPDGEGPFPAAILLSGCDGPHSNLDRLAGILAEAGWIALIVDSHGPRGLDRRQAWRLICAGQLLNGAERAADLAVAMAHLRTRPDVRQNDITLIGLSHGGWTILDFLALSEMRKTPPLLTEWPPGLGEPPHEGVRNAILFYPYCGLAAVGADAKLPVDVTYQFFLVSGDTIANEENCAGIVEQLQQDGAEASVTYFEGVTHGFDQQEKQLFSTLEYDEEAALQAIEQMLDLLRSRR